MGIVKNADSQMLNILWKQIEKALFPEYDSFWIFKIGQLLSNLAITVLNFPEINEVQLLIGAV